ncbi:phage fiber-tail adaptor protein [Denitromonas halophila]|uniref:Uncharacterized protein n=1 Tax=Denitromonas halophila TaxID=1629404 RepID=A0A557QX86_9RHOO|nr:hypothetical protein [Denitromonas halophila]TVO57528.1 hypothetical protein FHP91_07580 [Denitromonas halophila]
MRAFEPRRPGEAVTLTFDYTGQIPAGVTIVSVDPCDASVLRGTDANPAAVLVGAPALVGVEVLQRVSGGAVGVDYLLVARVVLSDGQSRELPAVQSVRRVF